MKHLISKTTTVVPVLALALAVGGCGGSSDDDDMMAGPTPQEACTTGGGQWNADTMTCTTADELAAARATEQRMAISEKISAARTAVNAVDNDSTDAEVTAAEMAISEAKMAIAAAADVPTEEKAANTETVTTLETQLSGAKMARMEAMDDAQKAADAAMAATAKKLYAGIRAPTTGDIVGGTFDPNDRVAAYDTAETAIVVSIGNGTDTPTAVSATLSEDKKTTVADNHGWAGKRYADPAGGDSYEAVVYSNVEAPKQGRKFGSAAAVTQTGAFEYQLTEGALANATTAFVAANVAFTGVTRTAGTETFELPDPNPTGADVILIPGSYHGVSGTYNCTPADAAAGCSAAVAAKGFTVSSADTWTFTPSNAEARVMEAADTAYASYGWWLYKSENGATYHASAFHDFKGTAGTVDIAELLGGTATYVGGAAGKYALASSTGGTNDAGHFTATATLEADFENDTITGTIGSFMGGDGEARDWSVALKEAAIGTDGAISRTAADDTVWTLGGTAADASGEWSGNLREEGTDGVPKAASGTFYSEYGTAGRMVGGFGANKQ